MFAEYVAIEIAVLAISAKLIGDFLRNFDVPRNAFALLLSPLFVFGTGFLLRLSGNKELIDIGFFFTEFSFLLVYIILTASLVLGQIKYWGLKRRIKKLSSK